MRDFNRPPAIHPADCRCHRCAPGQRGRLNLEIGLCALIVAASFVGAVLASLGTTN